MEKRRSKVFLLFCLLQQTPLCAISMVYNFRIAQITKQQILEQKKNNHVLVALFFDQFRRKYRGDVFQNYYGALGSYIYDVGSYYARVDAAFSHFKETRNKETAFSGTETDDILFTVGRNLVLDERKVMTISGLFGVPTHRTNRLRRLDVGYSQVGLGIQYDGSYALNKQKSLLYGARYIYFVPRKAYDVFDIQYRFTLGHIGDLLLAYKNNWNKNNGIEFGSTLRSRFAARIRPMREDIMQRTNYVRSNFYAVYKYKFTLGTTANRILLYSGYGFDHKPKKFGQKYIVTLWTSWNVSF